jgi:Flp pilus assembly protein TadG
MGQQQLLLIVLGVIIVGIAVVVGINLFNANAETSTQDSIVSQGTNIGAMAQQYFKKPTAMGGGGNSFVGFNTNVWPNLPSNLINSTDATWAVGTPTATQVVFTATPIDNNYEWTVITTVTDSSLASAVTPN